MPSRGGPSEERIAAALRTNQSDTTPIHSPPPVSRVTEKPLSATPVTISSRLTGVTSVLSVTPIFATGKQIGVTVTPKSSDNKEQLNSPQTLPDLVLNRRSNSTSITSTLSAPPVDVSPKTKDVPVPEPDSVPADDNQNQNITQDPQTTEDEEDAVDALLSLGSDLSQNISADDPLNENAVLMPIGAPATVQDVNPVEVKLDQVSVDKSIATIVEQEQLQELDRPTSQPTNTENNEQADSESTIPAEDLDGEQVETKPANAEDVSTSTPKKGSVEFKEYGVKRKVTDEKLKFKCAKCGKRTKTRKEQNHHYKETHDPIMCSVCDKVFTNPASLSIHMYEHMEPRFTCEICEKGFHFAGQLTQHKAVHRKEGKGTFKCMHSKCDRWFIRKGDLVVHLETHKKKDWKCPHCDHVTTCEKYLKTHVKSRHETDENDFPYKCAVCNRRFLYRQQLARHKEEHLKSKK